METFELKSKIQELERLISNSILDHADTWTLNKEVLDYKKQISEYRKLCPHTDEELNSTFKRDGNEIKCSICGQIQ